MPSDHATSPRKYHSDDDKHHRSGKIFETVIPFEDALTEVMNNLGALQFSNKISRYDSNGANARQLSDKGRRSGDTITNSTASSEVHQYWEIQRQSLEVQPLHDYLQKNDLANEQAYEWRSRLTTPTSGTAFIPMIVVCAQRLGIWFYRGPDSPWPPIRTWEAILFAEVMMLAP